VHTRYLSKGTMGYRIAHNCWRSATKQSPRRFIFFKATVFASDRECQNLSESQSFSRCSEAEARVCELRRGAAPGYFYPAPRCFCCPHHASLVAHSGGPRRRSNFIGRDPRKAVHPSIAVHTERTLRRAPVALSNETRAECVDATSPHGRQAASSPARRHCHHIV
jgi:hypothetical protein